MSKKINVMADIEQSVYDAVVVPHKQSKSFTTLIEALIGGYYHDPYIRNYADETLGGIQHQANDALNDVINNMHKSLANMGVYTEEIKSTAQDGMDSFGEKAQEVKKEVDDLQAAELQMVKETVEELRSQNEEIMGMLKMFMMGKAGVNVLPEGKETEKVVDAPNMSFREVEGVAEVSKIAEVSKVSEVADGVQDEMPLRPEVENVSPEEPEEEFDIFSGHEEESEEVVEEQEEVFEETSEEEANDILSNLLLGQEF